MFLHPGPGIPVEPITMRSAITVCLVEEARQGPFVYHCGLDAAFASIAELGFDAVEIFPPDAQTLQSLGVAALLERYQLKLAAVGTGAGWVRKQLTLVSPDASVRAAAKQFIRDVIDIAGPLGAPAIIGSMQGRSPDNAQRTSTLNLLSETLCELADYAYAQYNVPLLIEPLNRYETNLLNSVSDTAAWLRTLSSPHLRILADLFHMNIEEPDMGAALQEAGPLLGHVHFADSNRWAVGLGHSPIAAAINSLKQMQYAGYLSAEIFPKPDTETAARQTIKSFRQLTRD